MGVKRRGILKWATAGGICTEFGMEVPYTGRNGRGSFGPGRNLAWRFPTPRARLHAVWVCGGSCKWAWHVRGRAS